MHHGLCNGISIPWPMHCTMVQMVHTSHASWAVQQIIHSCVMGCTTYIHPMAHALYNCSDSTKIPCTMGCTTVYLSMYHGLYNRLSPHGAWIVHSTCIPCTIQQYICLITHGLYNAMSLPCIMGYTTNIQEQEFHHNLWNMQAHGLWGRDQSPAIIPVADFCWGISG